MFAHRLRFDSLPLLSLRLSFPPRSHIYSLRSSPSSSLPRADLLPRTRLQFPLSFLFYEVPFLLRIISHSCCLPSFTLALSLREPSPNLTITALVPSHVLENDENSPFSLATRLELVFFDIHSSMMSPYLDEDEDGSLGIVRESKLKRINGCARAVSIFLRPRMCMIGKRTSTEGWYASCTPKTRE